MNPTPPVPVSRRAFLQATTLLGVASAGSRLTAAPPPESPWQIGCYTRPWDEHEYRVALDGIAEAGFTHAGLMTAKGTSWVMITPETPVETAAKIGDEARQRGLKIASVYGGDFPTTSVAAGLAGLTRLIDCCRASGCRQLMLGGTGDPAVYDRYLEIIREGCGNAREKDVGLSIKPHGGLNATSPQCRRAIERVARPEFRLWYDPGNIFYYSDGRLDPVDDAPEAAGLVVGMSIKDFLPPKEVLVTPGSGQVRFREVFARLHAGGFRGGPLVVECVARGDVKQVIANARRARLLVEELVASVP